MSIHFRLLSIVDDSRQLKTFAKNYARIIIGLSKQKINPIMNVTKLVDRFLLELQAIIEKNKDSFKNSFKNIFEDITAEIILIAVEAKIHFLFESAKYKKRNLSTDVIALFLGEVISRRNNSFFDMQQVESLQFKLLELSELELP